MKLFESDRNNRIFSEVANKLLTECFLIKKRETDDYLFVIQNREKFSDFFGTIGYTVCKWSKRVVKWSDREVTADDWQVPGQAG